MDESGGSSTNKSLASDVNGEFFSYFFCDLFEACRARTKHVNWFVHLEFA